MNPITAYLNWINDPDEPPFPKDALSLSPMQILRLAQDDPDAMIRLNLIINNLWADRKPDIEQLALIHRKFHTHKPTYIKKEVTKKPEPIKQEPEYIPLVPQEKKEQPSWVKNTIKKPRRKTPKELQPTQIDNKIDFNDYMLVNLFVETDIKDPRNINEVAYILRKDREKIIIPSDEYVDMYFGRDNFMNVRAISELKKQRIPYSRRYFEINDKQREGFAVYAADIQLATQKILEWKNKYPKCIDNYYQLRMIDVDIEVYQDGYGRLDFTDLETSARTIPINLITVYDNYEDIYHTFIYNLNNSEIHLDKITDYLDYKDEKMDIKLYDSETDMLLDFFKLLRELDPDICLSWNGTEFDWPYIYYRCRALRLPMGLAHNKKYELTYRKTTNKLGEEITYTINRLGYMIDLDYERCYKERTLSRRENYKLNTIAKIELGIEKIDTSDGMDKMFRETPEMFIAYNINDVHLVRRLDEKLKYTDLCFTLTRISNISWDSIYTTLRICDGLIYEKLLSQGKTVKVLNKSKNAVKQGAYVRTPVVGFSEYVGDLDATSMYPYIMARYNISADTMVGYIEPDIAHHYIYDKDTFHKLDKFSLNLKVGGEYRNYNITPERFDASMEKNDYIITHAGTIFRSHEQQCSILYEIIDMLISLRKQYKDLMKEYVNTDKMLYERYKTYQFTVKIITNSLYGAQANENFRLYSKEVAESITATGREIIKLSAYVANEYIQKIVDSGNIEMKEDITIPTNWPEKAEGLLPNVIYGDSVIGSSVIDTDKGKKQIEQILEHVHMSYQMADRKYVLNPGIKVLSQNGKYENVLSIMKHKTRKKMYEISDDEGHTITVTEDHSIMVRRNGEIIGVKPTEIRETDRLILNARRE